MRIIINARISGLRQLKSADIFILPHFHHKPGLFIIFACRCSLFLNLEDRDGPASGGTGNVADAA